jgi:zinc protease
MQIKRTEIPFNDSGIILNIPQIQKSNFGNIIFYKYQDNSQPLINFKINFKNGAAADTKPGLANFTMAMLQGGTKSKSATQIFEEFESFGASYFFNAYWDECAAGFSCLSDFFNPCFEVLLDCIKNPEFSDSEFNRQMDKIAASIMQNSADPSYIAQVAFNKGIFNSHPYGHPRTGNLDDISSITKDDILSFYDLLMNKSDISIIVTGNFNEIDIDAIIEKSFSDLKQNSNQVNIPHHIAGKVPNVIAGKDDALQTNLRIGKPSINRHHPDYPAFQIINTIFGGYFLSRLNHVLRETKGLTYGINSYLDTRKYGSIFVISTSINMDKTSEAIKDIFDISIDISKNKFDKHEIARSVEYMTGSFARSLETPKQITGLIQTLDSFDLDVSFLTGFYAKIRNLSIDEIFEVQKKYFSDTDYLIATSGNIKFLSEAIAGFGEYTILDI